MPSVLAGGLLLAVCLLSGLAQADEAMQARIALLAQSRGTAVGGIALGSEAVLAELYRERGYRLIWEPARARTLLGVLEASQADGLRPDDFHVEEIRTAFERGGLTALPSAERVELDILLSDSLLRYLHHHLFGKVDPVSLDANWNHADGAAFDELLQAMREALAAASLKGHLDARLQWPRAYVDLRNGLARYREIAARGGWPIVPDGETIKPGMQDARVPLIRARLEASGDHGRTALPAGELDYDPELQAAVERFQARHGLFVDGIVGPRTRAAMNVSVETRIDQIRLNLERMRWVVGDLPQDYLVVNIPAYRVDLYRGGAVVWSGRAIVGQPARETPVFRDELAYLELNPTWTVPPTILAEDLLPNLREDPSYLQTRGLRVIDYQGRGVSPEAVDWTVSAKAFPYLLRQPPGDDNALGRIKFMFPNRYSVYLHDTPQRALFSRAMRALSSGCVRVEDPLRLAELVLDEPQRWNAETFQAALETEETRVVRLAKPLPVLLSYWTAEADADGRVSFYNDIYARDDALLRALDGGRQGLPIAPPPGPLPQTVDTPREPQEAARVRERRAHALG